MIGSLFLISFFLFQKFDDIFLGGPSEKEIIEYMNKHNLICRDSKLMGGEEDVFITIKDYNISK